MVGVYFSGTGNTKHCVNEFLKACGGRTPAVSIEESAAIAAIDESDSIVVAYPIYYSNLPKIVRDFLLDNKSHFCGKKIFVIATMGLFSGDGAGCAARLLRRFGADVIGGLHLKMPDCIGDVKLLKKTLEENKRLVANADAKIAVAADKLKRGRPTREGLNVFYHIAGLFGQRLWFFNETKNYSNQLRIDGEKCLSCGSCVKLCPMNNIKLADGKAVSSGKCTMCYRCVNNCPNRAITLLGKEVVEQCRFEHYTDHAVGL